MVPIISRWPSSSVPVGEAQRPRSPESLVVQGIAVSESGENGNVRKPGWLFSFEADYHRRASDKHYQVDVLVALPGGGGAL